MLLMQRASLISDELKRLRNIRISRALYNSMRISVNNPNPSSRSSECSMLLADRYGQVDFHSSTTSFKALSDFEFTSNKVAAACRTFSLAVRLVKQATTW